MSIQPAAPLLFDFFEPLPVAVESHAVALTSDAGLLPLRQFDERIGLTAQFAATLHDPRVPALIDHSFAAMVRMRLYGILADYTDQNDHDTLRTDPICKLLAGRAPDGDDLASQPTLSRFENAIAIPSLKRLRDLFLDQFMASFARPPRRLTFDLDAVDDPTHGAQQVTLLHGFFGQYQYFPLVITSADTDQVVLVSLRHGTAHAALGADADLEYLVGRLRQVWPDVAILVRADAGFGVPWMYDAGERLRIRFPFGLARNAVLQRPTEGLLAEAVQRWEQTGAPQRLFSGFWYQAGGWHPYHTRAGDEADDERKDSHNERRDPQAVGGGFARSRKARWAPPGTVAFIIVILFASAHPYLRNPLRLDRSGGCGLGRPRYDHLLAAPRTGVGHSPFMIGGLVFGGTGRTSKVDHSRPSAGTPPTPAAGRRPQEWSGIGRTLRAGPPRRHWPHSPAHQREGKKKVRTWPRHPMPLADIRREQRTGRRVVASHQEAPPSPACG